MVAYSFQKQFIGPVLAGLEPGPWLPGMKRHTLRVPRRGRAGHARPEQPVHLYTAMRTRHCRQLGRATAVAQIPVWLVWGGERLTVQRRPGPAPRSRVSPLAPIVRGLLEATPGDFIGPEGMEEFARADGFRDLAEMTAFFEVPAEPATLEMVLIAWCPGSTR